MKTLWFEFRDLFKERLNFIEDKTCKSLLMTSKYKDDEIKVVPVSSAQETYGFVANILLNEHSRKQGVHLIAQGDIAIKFLEFADSEIKRTRKGILEKEPYPEDETYFEFECYVYLVSLLYDRWYENGQRTGPRCQAIKFAGVIWKMLMGYRLWRRAGIIFSGQSPVWCSISEFSSCTLCQKPREADENSVIVDWSPETVYNAAEVFLLGRGIESRSSILFRTETKVIRDYRDALLDKLALIAFFRLRGPKDDVMEMELKWFKGTKENQIPDEELYSETETAAIQKAIKLLREESLSEMREENASFARKDTDVVTGPKKTMKEMIDLLRITGVMKRTEDLQEQLDHLKQRSEYIAKFLVYPADHIMSPAEKEDYDADSAMLVGIQSEIALIQTEMRMSKKDDELKKKKADEIEMAGFLERLSNKQDAGRVEYFVPTMQWFTVNSFISIGLYSWQIHSRMPVNLSCPIRFEVKRILMDTFLESLQRLNNATFIQRARQYIMERDTKFWERERFRSSLSSKARFTLLDAFRHNRPREDDDEEENDNTPTDAVKAEYDPLPGFPESVSELLDTKNPYHFQGMAYIVHWFLAQTYPNVDVDRVFFREDAEYEYLNLFRDEMCSPTMSRVGADWVILPGGSWETKDDLLRCVFCGPNILDCLTEFLRLVEADNWLVFDRKRQGMCSLFGSTLQVITKNINFKAINKPLNDGGWTS